MPKWLLMTYIAFSSCNPKEGDPCDFKDQPKLVCICDQKVCNPSDLGVWAPVKEIKAK